MSGIDAILSADMLAGASDLSVLGRKMGFRCRR